MLLFDRLEIILNANRGVLVDVNKYIEPTIIIERETLFSFLGNVRKSLIPFFWKSVKSAVLEAARNVGTKIVQEEKERKECGKIKKRQIVHYLDGVLTVSGLSPMR